MKHVYLPGGIKYYALCSIDPYTKEACVHVAKTCSSHQTKLALEKTIDTFGGNIVILNDNGSENRGEAYKCLEDKQILQYFAHPCAPKEKPFTERFIGSLERECLTQCRQDITSLKDLDYYITRWLNNCHYLRSHQSLDYQTPSDYCATLGSTITRRKVSTM